MFRPCIDLHQGKVKQIVGGSLCDAQQGLKTNFVSDRGSAWFAELYRKDHLQGGHVIMLGPGNEVAAKAALSTYPKGLQVGGGITQQNASSWLDAGASHVIVTSWVFNGGILNWDRLQKLTATVAKKKLVLDLSCRKKGNDYFIVTNRWQSFTNEKMDQRILERLAEYCDEFLIHSADVEGLCLGMDHSLVAKLDLESPITTTYAGGAKSLKDLEDITRISDGRIHLTIGSALDIFGGDGVIYKEAVEFNNRILNANTD